MAGENGCLSGAGLFGYAENIPLAIASPRGRCSSRDNRTPFARKRTKRAS
jgi:hypothetical protein